jgi:hypothetical protein
VTLLESLVVFLFLLKFTVNGKPIAREILRSFVVSNFNIEEQEKVSFKCAY